MAKKDRRGKYLILQDVRVFHDEKTGNIHLTSKDKDLPKHYNFNLTLNSDKSSELALRKLLFDKGILETMNTFVFLDEHGEGSQDSEGPWDRITLGINKVGKDVFWYLKSNSTMLISGEAGTGKSVVTYGIINHCLKHADRWKLSIVSSNRTEHSPISNDYPNVEVKTDRTEVLKMVSDIYDEMMERYRIMEDQKVNNFEYLAVIPSARLLIMDDASSFLSQVGIQTNEGKENDALTRNILEFVGHILRLGRPAGIFSVISVSSYHLTNEMISEEMRKNFDVRIHMGRGSEHSSFMTLGKHKALSIPNSVGRGYVQPDNSRGEEVQFYPSSLRY